MQTEFEWKIFPVFTTLSILEEIQKLMKSLQCEPEHFNGRIIVMSMHTDIAWGENENTEECAQIFLKKKVEIRSQFPLRSSVILGT